MSQEQQALELQLQNLADNLSFAINLSTNMRVQIHLIDSDEANAFATLGGQVFVF